MKIIDIAYVRVRDNYPSNFNNVGINAIKLYHFHPECLHNLFLARKLYIAYRAFYWFP